MPKPNDPAPPSTLAQKKLDLLKLLAQEALKRDKPRTLLLPPTFRRVMTGPRWEDTRTGIKQPQLIDGNRSIYLTSGVNRASHEGPPLDHPNVRQPYPTSRKNNPDD